MTQKILSSFIFSLLFGTTLLFGGLVDAISIVVNNQPITLYQIREYTLKYHVDPNQAIQMLIREQLENALMQKYGIEANENDVYNEMEKISSKAGLTLSDFEHYLIKKGVNLDEYKNELAKKIAKRKLYKKIVSSKIKRPTPQELKSYYEQHLDSFSIPQMIEVVEYDAKTKKDLEDMIKNPMLNSNNISKSDKVLRTETLNPKLLYILQQTKEGSFTPVLSLNNGYITFYIKKKINQKPLPFEQVQNSIYAQIMDQREKDIIKSYFDKMISEANIKIIRKPM